MKNFGYDKSEVALQSQPLEESSVAKTLKRDGHLPGIDAGLFEKVLPVFMQMMQQNERLAYEFHAESSLKAEMTLFVAQHEHDIDIADRWRAFLASPPDVHGIAVSHAQMREPASFAKIGTILASKLQKQRLRQSDQSTYVRGT